MENKTSNAAVRAGSRQVGTDYLTASRKNQADQNQTDQIDWVTSIPFFSVHFIALAGLFVFPLTLSGIFLCLGMYYLRMFGVTAGYHRYFSHRSFKTSRIFQFFLALLATTSTQKGVLWWAAHHRDHHRFSDMPEDVHSPVQRGFWWSHLGWILASRYQDTNMDRVRDLTKYPELRWLDKHYIIPVLALALSLFFLGGLHALYWGFFVSTVLLWHGTFTINSLAHVWGKRRYNTTDQSRNNFLLALITMGEGWHNNHHYYMNSARQGFRWWEIDLTFYVLKGLAILGIVRELRPAPVESSTRDLAPPVAARV